MMMKITVCPRAGWGVVPVSHWPVSTLDCPLIGQCWHDNEVWLLKLNTQLQVLSSTLPPPLLVISNRTQIVS